MATFLRIRQLSTIFFLSVVLLNACTSSALPPTSMIAPFTTHQIGRFEVQLPASFYRAGSRYVLQYVKLEEHQGSFKDSIQLQAWSQRLQQIEALKEHRELPEDVQGTIIKIPPVHATLPLQTVWYHADGSKETANWGGLLQRKQTNIWLTTTGDITWQAEGLKRVEALAAAYQLKSDGSPVSPSHAFYTNYGYLNVPYQDQEEAWMVVRDSTHQAELNMNFSDPEDGIPSKFVQVLQRFANRIIISLKGIKTVRNCSRTVAYLRGEELILVDKKENYQKLLYTWRYVGQLKSGQEILITLKLEVPQKHQTWADETWKHLLTSFQPVK